MIEIQTLLFSFPKHSHDMRMLLDRVLEPGTAHPLVRDLLEGLRSARFGETHLALAAIRNQLGITQAMLQRDLAHLMFANALHSPTPFATFQYLIDSGFDSEPCATGLMEHMALGNYFHNRDESFQLFHWFMERGGLIVPESKAAWKALGVTHPEVFTLNNSRYEAQKLESYIRSQSLEVREAPRL